MHSQTAIYKHVSEHQTQDKEKKDCLQQEILKNRRKHFAKYFSIPLIPTDVALVS